MIEAMKYKLPPLPKPDTHCFDEDTGKDVWSHSPEQMQAYAIAAIEAQGVSDGWQLVPKEPTIDMIRELNASGYMVHKYKKMLASAPPAPQASVVQQEPLYQIKMYGSQTAWHDAGLSAYEVTPEKDRRIVYRAPQAKPQPLSVSQRASIYSALLCVELPVKESETMFKMIVEAVEFARGITKE